MTGRREEESLPENRRFHRVAVAESALIELELPDGEKVTVRDISFGGLALPPVDIKDSKFSGILRVLDKTYRCQLSESHRSPEHIGYLFEEGNESVLVFLQPIMNALHQGASLRSIDASVLKEEMKQRYTWVLRGDGPTDILIESNRDATFNCLMTLRSDKAYRQITWRDGIISTARLLDERGVAPRMNPDRDPDIETLKQAMLILAGALEQDTFKRPLKALLDSLQNLYWKQ